MNWDDVELSRLSAALRASLNPADAEKTIWSFEQALSVARVDGDLLDHVAAAALCLIARRDGTTPRAVSEVFFRRSVSDESWRERYLPLLA